MVVLSSPLWGLSLALAQEASSAPVASGGESAFRTVGVALAAAIALSVSVLGSSYAVARIGSAALGAASEKPELLTRSILFVALAEGLAVLGFAIAMVLARKI